MPLIQVGEVTVDFPKDPYPCQVDYMKQCIKALEMGSNALLESPTGTGKVKFYVISINKHIRNFIVIINYKTLCLLCSTLAWQSHHQKKLPPSKGKLI